jgi:hypothetical protein
LQGKFGCQYKKALLIFTLIIKELIDMTRYCINLLMEKAANEVCITARATCKSLPGVEVHVDTSTHAAG